MKDSQIEAAIDQVVEADDRHPQAAYKREVLKALGFSDAVPADATSKGYRVTLWRVQPSKAAMRAMSALSAALAKDRRKGSYNPKDPRWQELADIRDDSAAKIGARAVAKLQKQLDELGYSDVKAGIRGAEKSLVSIIVPYSKPA